jgi:F-type H+-transporting ATPase subunit delta
MLSVVGTRYARALMDVVLTPGSPLNATNVLGELRTVGGILSSSGDLQSVLLSPAVSPPRKRAVLARLMEPLGVSKQVQNFVFVVIDHRRIHQFSQVVEAFDALLDDRLGLIRADVASATPLSAGQQAELEGELSRISGKKAKLNFTTDPSLVAGVVARVGSTVYDGSVRGQLEKLRVMLAS